MKRLLLSLTQLKQDIKYYIAQDVGCDDFDKAARNREMVAQKEKITNYLLIEHAVTKAPIRCPILYYHDSTGQLQRIPLGHVPSVSKQDWQQFGGGRESEAEPRTFIVESPPPATTLELD